QRHAVPLVQAMGADLVPRIRQGGQVELLGLRLGLLQGQDVHVVALQEGEHALHPCPQRIDVPGRDAHEVILRGSAYARPPPANRRKLGPWRAHWSPGRPPDWAWSSPGSWPAP